MDNFWKIMLPLIGFLAVGWVIYYVYNFIMDQKEKKRPRNADRLEKANEEFKAYADRLQKHEKQTYDRDQLHK